MSKDLLVLFTTEQHANEIVSALSNTEIDKYLEVGVRILMDAHKHLEEGKYIEYGISKEEVELDIARIEYNLNVFTEAFVTKENMIVITKYPKAMFFHMN